jgi:UDP-N-acetylmuramoylalanine-D-glutamate ligase
VLPSDAAAAAAAVATDNSVGKSGASGIANGGKDDSDCVTGRVLRTELGPHKESTFASADVIVLSPGVPLKQPQVAAALAGAFGPNVAVISELAFAAQCLPESLPIAAVTGTNGKSTVSTFTGQLLAACGARVFVGGNLGIPLSECALEFVMAARRRRRSGEVYSTWSAAATSWSTRGS